MAKSKDIALILDTHLTDISPRSRKDDYFDSVLSKIVSVLSRHHYVIILGDMFNKPAIPIEYLNKLINVLSPFKGRLFSIVGNHDAYYRNMGSMGKTAIQLLENAGVLKILPQHFSMEGMNFDTVSVVPELQMPEKKGDILLGHAYFQKGGKESLNLEDVLGYKYVFLGHDHEPYEDYTSMGTTVVRSGSLTRTDSQEYNLKREFVEYSVLSCVNGIVDYRKESLDLKPTDDVFFRESIIKPLVKVNQSLESLTRLVSGFDTSETKPKSLSSVLVDLKVSESAIKYLELTLESLGVPF